MVDLYPFQQAGVDRLHALNGNALLADEQGLGKTRQSLVWADEADAFPLLIVCQASLKHMWQRAVKEFTGKDSILLSGQTPAEESVESEVFIINYEVLQHWQEWLMFQGLKAIVCDEAQMIANRKNKRSQAAREISSMCEHVLMLTGTPMIGKPDSLWHLLHLVDPASYHSFTSFTRTFCKKRRRPWGMDYFGSKNEERLHRELKSLMIRRLKSEVLKDLPEQQLSVVPIPLRDRTEYDRVQFDFLSWAKEKRGDAYAGRAAKAEQLVRMNNLKLIAAKAKFRGIVEWIDDFLQTGEKLVVFGIHKKMMDALERRVDARSVKITGDTPKNIRQGLVDQFQEDPETRVFLGNIAAAGAGLTLTAASNVAFVELDWRPHMHSQASARCHRIGQKNTVTSHYLIAMDTIEERLAKVLQEKQELLSAVVDGGSRKDDIDIYDKVLQAMK